MECFGAVFARVTGGDVAALEAAIVAARRDRHRGPLGVLSFDAAKHDFAVVDRWGRSDDPPEWFEDIENAEELATYGRAVGDDLAKLSSLCGEVVAEYSIESDLCRFAHWRAGELVRVLEWSEGTWQAPTGSPQAWEQALFGPAWLDASLEVAGDAGVDPAEVRSVFAAGRIVEGSRWPTLITANVSVSAALRAALRLPPFGFQPWPRRRELVEKLPKT